MNFNTKFWRGGELFCNAVLLKREMFTGRGGRAYNDAIQFIRIFVRTNDWQQWNFVSKWGSYFSELGEITNIQISEVNLKTINDVQTIDINFNSKFWSGGDRFYRPQSLSDERRIHIYKWRILHTNSRKANFFTWKYLSKIIFLHSSVGSAIIPPFSSIKI